MVSRLVFIMVFGTTSAWRLAASLLLTMEAGAKAQRSAYPDSCTDPYKRATDPQCSLLFPGDGLNGYGNPDEEPSDSRAWRKGKLALGGEYWWRETGDGEPEISLTNPFDEWKVGRLEDSGREYFWRERDSEEDGMEVRLASFDGEEPDSTDAPWRIGQLPSGREYLWRETSDPDDPEVQWWSQSTLDSGEPFWYDEDGEVSLTDPFARARALADEE